jgi:hypothetical protein
MRQVWDLGFRDSDSGKVYARVETSMNVKVGCRKRRAEVMIFRQPMGPKLRQRNNTSDGTSKTRGGLRWMSLFPLNTVPFSVSAFSILSSTCPSWPWLLAGPRYSLVTIRHAIRLTLVLFEDVPIEDQLTRPEFASSMA